ncbi:hypothetical protein S40288_02663 [Stachybotrys chartarum IBT 40288]|nr:hypothetical protein S40288_02663 [Stachybotrys chartarum IBT 40288]
MKLNIALLFALAASATAIPHPDTVITVIKRLTTTVHTPLARRQDNDERQCASAASSLLNEWNDDPPPTPEISLVSALETYISANDIDTATAALECGGFDVTGTLSAPYAEWSSSYSEWYDEHRSDFQEFYAACSDVESVSSELNSLVGECTEVLGPTVSDNGAGPKETGAAVAAAAGLAGMVIAAM